MNGLIRGSLKNPYAVTVMALAILVLGGLTLQKIPIDILPVFKAPAVQVLTFYGGMPAEGMEKDITNRMERWVGQANGMARQESRSIVGASIVRNYFQTDADPNGALTQVNSLSTAAIPNLPPGTLPPVVLPFDPTSTVPVSLVALDSKQEPEAVLYDVGRYEVRNMIMSIPGAVAPVVYGGKIRAVMLYLDRIKMQARGLSPTDVMNSMDNYNLFLPTGSVKLGFLDYAVNSNSMFDFVYEMGEMPLRSKYGNAAYMRDVATPSDSAYHPDEHRPRQWPPPGLCSGLPAVGGQHAERRRHAQEIDSRHDGAAQQVGHRSESRHGPVGLCANVDLCAGAGRHAGRDPLLAGDSDLPRPVADDVDCRDDHSLVRAGRRSPACIRLDRRST